MAGLQASKKRLHAARCGRRWKVSSTSLTYLAFRLWLSACPNYSYLHVNGFIHRDVKAANMLIDDDGTVLLGDLGVAASLNDEEPTPTRSGSGQMNFDETVGADSSNQPVAGPSTKKLSKRKSFVGTVGNINVS